MRKGRSTWLHGLRNLCYRSLITKLLAVFSVINIILLIFYAHSTWMEYEPGIFRRQTYHRKHGAFEIIEVKGGNKTYFDIAKIETRLLARRVRVATVCRNHEREFLGKSSERWAYDRMELDKQRNTLYCPLLKVGSTFWRRILFAMRAKLKIITPYDVSITRALRAKTRSLSHLLPLTSVKAKRFFNSSTNFMFVREPFSRLLSGYVDKLFAPNPYYWKHVGIFIIHKYRKNPSRKSLRCGHDVTFPEFIKYVIDSEKYNTSYRDAHFTPTFDTCKPCQIHYDIIGDMSTFNEDTSYILHALGYNITRETLRGWHAKYEEDAIIDSTLSPFSVRNELKRCMPLHEATMRIWHKMQLRGIVRRNAAIPKFRHFMKIKPAKAFIEAMFKSRWSSGNTISKKRQQHEVLQTAYSKIPTEDLQELRLLFKADFRMFGYSPYPKHVFPNVPIDYSWVFNMSMYNCET